jgi:hypothetical protein
MSANPDSDFLNRLRVLVEIAGSVSALGRNSGISESSIRKYLTGSEPTRPVLVALSRATGVRLAWLVNAEGTVCEPKSTLLQRARHLIALEANKALGLPEFREEGLTGALRQFSEEYESGTERYLAPDWVRMVVPAFSDIEADAWRLGQLDYQAPRVEDKLIHADPIVVARVAQSIRRVLGNKLRDATAELEAHLFTAGCMQVHKFGEGEVPENILDTFLAFSAFEFEKSSSAK